MTFHRTAAWAALLLVTGTALTGCASAAPAPAVTVTVAAGATATPAAAVTTAAAAVPKTATAVARGLKEAIPTVKKVVKITEDNDPNNLIGRPNGYDGAAVVKDRRVECSDGLGADCGASIEQWPTTADAKARKKYIQTILKASPILGSEYDTVQGRFLLRVAGDLKPSQAKKYAAAFSDFFD